MVVVVPLACRNCLYYVDLEIGASTEVSSSATWYCPRCATQATADLGAPLLRVRPSVAPSAPGDRAWNPKVAALVEESRQRVAEHRRNEVPQVPMSPDELAADDEARRRHYREVLEELISIERADLADRSK